MQIAEKSGSVYNGIKDAIRFLISKQNVFAAAERRKRFGLRAKKIENKEGEWMMRWRKRTAAKLCAVFMVCSMLAGLLPVSVPAQGAEQKEAVWNGKRQVLNFNREWKFIRQDAEGAEAEEYNDSGWYMSGFRMISASRTGRRKAIMSGTAGTGRYLRRRRIGLESRFIWILKGCSTQRKST